MKPTSDKQKHSLKQALSRIGSQAAMARLLTTTEHCVKPQNVHSWLKTGRIPAEHVLRVEHFTGVSRFDLRPDVFCIPEDLKIA